MNKEKEIVENHEHEEVGHVHGPNCNHGHHHHHDLKPFVRATEKIGRNDPCSCGSNQKFKKCCGK
jgi:uncharacterized protein YchJ